MNFRNFNLFKKKDIMETHFNGSRGHGDSQSYSSTRENGNADDIQDDSNAENMQANTDSDALGNDIPEHKRAHKNHQEHGNRTYQSHTNHSSADDQPGTTTDTNLGRDLNSH